MLKKPATTVHLSLKHSALVLKLAHVIGLYGVQKIVLCVFPAPSLLLLMQWTSTTMLFKDMIWFYFLTSHLMSTKILRMVVWKLRTIYHLPGTVTFCTFDCVSSAIVFKLAAVKILKFWYSVFPSNYLYSDDSDTQQMITESLLNTDDSFEEMEKLAFISSCIIDSVKAGGSVLIPIGRLGIVLQLLECISCALESLNLKVWYRHISSWNYTWYCNLHCHYLR